MLLAAKRDYYTDKIASCGSNQKQLFDITKSLLGVSCHAQLPSCVSPNDLAQRFSNHFEKKVSDIQHSIAHRSGDCSYAIAAAFSDDTALGSAKLTSFTGVNASDVSKLIADSPCKSCGLDPLPTWLLKLCSSELVAVITAIINSSLKSSTVPDAFKQVVVRPVLKKVTLDEDALCSYRTFKLSNSPFLSKLVEKVIARQLNIHLDMNTLRDPFQSAYCHGYSTETALLRVKNDIAATLDEKGKVVFVMLDLSSAFDTINHNILMNRLQHSVGITDAALSWLHLYITERYWRVAVDSATSADCVMKCGVPQGSVLGPILYCIYTRPICDIVARHGLKYH